MTRLPAILAAGLACTACAGDPGATPPPTAPPAAATGCLAAGDGQLIARLRGAVVADLNWDNAGMQCDGGQRPDGQGLRLTFAGTLPAEGGVGAARQLRFIFGVDLKDAAPGVAQALPTNLTLIFEGEQQLFATRGDDHCAVETLERTPLLAGNGRQQRVHARGYCTSPAVDLSGNASLLVPTFEFTGLITVETAP
jgi:hypothetical protein